MGPRFRHSFKLFPGARVNLGMRGVSASIGVPGTILNVSRRGVRGAVGIPGSGLSYSTMLTPAGGAATAPRAVPEAEVSYWEPPANPAPQPATPHIYMRPPGTREIGSAAVESLTSAGLVEFRQMIVDTRTQRGEIESDLGAARAEYKASREELSNRKGSLFRWFFKRRIAELEEAVPKLGVEVERLEAWLEATHIEVTFEASDAAQRAYAAVVRAYDTLRTCKAIWDVTSDRDANKVVERTTASRVVERRPVALDYSASELIRFTGKALRFANVNGDDILIYPGLILMPRADGQFALLDVREVAISANGVNFIEDERVPADAKVVGRTWAKVNKDGSPDRRFKDNHEVPVCQYGQMRFTSPTGLTEEYQFSNAEAALAFAQAYEGYKAALAIEALNRTDPAT